MEVKGSIYKIESTIDVSDKFKKREFIVKVEGTYPQYIPLQCTQDKVVMLDNLAEGQNVTCHINMKGRLWVSPKSEEKCFLTLECWKLELVGEKLEAPTAGTAVDDLPF